MPSGGTAKNNCTSGEPAAAYNLPSSVSTHFSLLISYKIFMKTALKSCIDEELKNLIVDDFLGNKRKGEPEHRRVWNRGGSWWRWQSRCGRFRFGKRSRLNRRFRHSSPDDLIWLLPPFCISFSIFAPSLSLGTLICCSFALWQWRLRNLNGLDPNKNSLLDQVTIQEYWIGLGPNIFLTRPGPM